MKACGRPFWTDSTDSTDSTEFVRIECLFSPFFSWQLSNYSINKKRPFNHRKKKKKKVILKIVIGDIIPKMKKVGKAEKEVSYQYACTHNATF